MAKPVKQIVLSPEQTARIRRDDAQADLAAATQAFVEEARLAASLGVVHRLYPPRSEP